MHTFSEKLFHSIPQELQRIKVYQWEDNLQKLYLEIETIKLFYVIFNKMYGSV
jgi:hypothetical protein